MKCKRCGSSGTKNFLSAGVRTYRGGIKWMLVTCKVCRLKQRYKRVPKRFAKDIATARAYGRWQRSKVSRQIVLTRDEAEFFEKTFKIAKPAKHLRQNSKSTAIEVKRKATAEQ